MDAVDIVKVCARRWYVMLPVLLGAAGVSSQLVEAQETTYTAAASYGLVQPGLTPAGREAEEANPLGPSGGALVGAALEAQLNSRETQELLGGGGTRGWGPGEVVNRRSYVVGIPQFETTYEVRAWGEDEQEVRAVVERVIAAAPRVADELQVRAKVPPAQRYQPFVLAPTQVDVLPTTGWVKLVVAVMGVGVLMGAVWSLVVDRALRWRRQSRRVVSQSGVATTHEHDMGKGDDAQLNGPWDGRANGQLKRPVKGPVKGPAKGPVKGPLNGPLNGPMKGPVKGPVNELVKGRADGPANRGTTGTGGSKPSIRS